jgi:hypothetical protein
MDTWCHLESNILHFRNNQTLFDKSVSHFVQTISKWLYAMAQVVLLLIQADSLVEYQCSSLATLFGTRAIGFSLLQSEVTVHRRGILKFNFLANNTCLHVIYVLIDNEYKKNFNSELEISLSASKYSNKNSLFHFRVSINIDTIVRVC